MSKFYNYLNEKLIKINQKDIDMIYEPLSFFVKLLNKYIEEMEKGNWGKADSLKEQAIYYVDEGEIVTTIHSDSLISKKAQMAHEIKPIKIYIIPRLRSTNHYDPLNNKIELGIIENHLNALLVNYEHWSSTDRKRLKNEFKPERMKSTIRHELTHWIDDALHSGYLTNLVKKAMDAKVHGDMKLYKKIVNQGFDVVNLTDKEINAIVNQLDQVRKELGKKLWNMLTWEDLESRLSTIYSQRYSEKVGYEFRKKLKKRMAREGILGKNMR